MSIEVLQSNIISANINVYQFLPKGSNNIRNTPMRQYEAHNTPLVGQ